MMFEDLLHTWIASERGGTEQTRKLSRDGGLGQGDDLPPNRGLRRTEGPPDESGKDLFQ